MHTRIIGHIDMDAFFASVEERDKPYLKGLPVIVGADPQEGRGRGVVSTANYVARELGIHSALPIQKAWQLCEEARKRGDARCVFITSGFSRYGGASREVFALVREHVPTISQTSVDEAYLDLSFCKTFKSARLLAECIQKGIRKKLQLSCSIGIGNSKMVAKIASDVDKPKGITVVYPRSTEVFLRALSVRALPGVGVKAYAALSRRGITTVADIQKLSWEELYAQFGKHGLSMWERARGIDEREVSAKKPKRKSIGKHHTFASDTKNMEEVVTVMDDQAKTICREVKRQGFSSFTTVVVTVRFADFSTTTRSLTADAPMHSLKDLKLKALKLVMPFFESTENPSHKAIRLIGVRVEKLV